jgi:hypothetical protein
MYIRALLFKRYSRLAALYSILETGRQLSFGGSGFAKVAEHASNDPVMTNATRKLLWRNDMSPVCPLSIRYADNSSSNARPKVLKLEQIAHELARALSNDHGVRLGNALQPRGKVWRLTDSALYPIITQIERAARFAYDDTTQVRLDKLDTLLSQSFMPRHDVALLAEMLSLPDDGRNPMVELGPQQRRQKTLEALSVEASRSNARACVAH